MSSLLFGSGHNRRSNNNSATSSNYESSFGIGGGGHTPIIGIDHPHPSALKVPSSSVANHHHHNMHTMNGNNHHHHPAPRVREMPDFLRNDDSRDRQQDDEEDDGMLLSPPQHTGMDDHSVTSVSSQQRDEYERTINGFGMKKAVQYSRMAVLVILLVSAVGLAVFIYQYTSHSETHQFESQFAEDARKVLEHVGTELDFTMGAADAFLLDEINSAEQTNQTWPFVTNQRFAVRAAKLRSLTKALVVITYPYVTEEQRPKWENYSVAHDGWVDEGLLVQQNDKNFQGTQVSTWDGWGRIHGNGGLHIGPGPYFPTWCTYPIVPIYAPYNWDIRLVSEPNKQERMNIGWRMLRNMLMMSMM